jgi:hypothetical protein
MAKRRSRADNESPLVEWLENHRVGRYSIVLVGAGWVGLVLLALGVTHWSLEVTFFLVVGWLTLVLSALSFTAAFADHQRRRASGLFRLEQWKDFEEYVLWLTPMGFAFGLVFAHYFWH